MVSVSTFDPVIVIPSVDLPATELDLPFIGLPDLAAINLFCYSVSTLYPKTGLGFGIEGLFDFGLLVATEGPDLAGVVGCLALLIEDDFLVRGASKVATFCF